MKYVHYVICGDIKSLTMHVYIQKSSRLIVKSKAEDSVGENNV